MNRTSDRLLLIDDDSGIRELFSNVARKLGFDVRATDHADEFKKAFLEFEPTALVLDLNLPSVDGVELLRFLSTFETKAQILLVSGEDPRVLAAAERLGVKQGLNMTGTLHKPMRVTELERLLGHLMQPAIDASELKAAIYSGELVLHYQPKLEKISGRWTTLGVEALVRWKHRERGLVMPGEFVPIAEQTDLIAPLTDFVLREALEQTTIWRNHGFDLNVAVNIAPTLLTDVEFPDRLSSLLQEYELNGSSLALEITESAVMTYDKTSIDILTRLRLKGIELSIDDFGTGHSSMRQLLQLPFSELKMDRSFIGELSKSEEAKTVVSSIIQLAHNLGMRVCAEGIESAEALEILVRLGCDIVQGFLFCKPVSASEIEQFVASGVGFDVLAS